MQSHAAGTFWREFHSSIPEREQQHDCECAWDYDDGRERLYLWRETTRGNPLEYGDWAPLALAMLWQYITHQRRPRRRDCLSLQPWLAILSSPHTNHSAIASVSSSCMILQNDSQPKIIIHRPTPIQ